MVSTTLPKMNETHYPQTWAWALNQANPDWPDLDVHIHFHFCRLFLDINTNFDRKDEGQELRIFFSKSKSILILDILYISIFQAFSWHKYQFRPQASRWREGVPHRRSNLMSMPRLCSEQFYITKIQKQAKYS